MHETGHMVDQPNTPLSTHITVLMEPLIYARHSSGCGYTTVNKTNEVPHFLKLTKSSREDRPQVNKQTNKV